MWLFERVDEIISGLGRDVMTIYSTIWAPSIPESVIVLRRDQMSRYEILRALRQVRDGDAVLLNGALGFSDRWIDLLYGLALKLRGKRVTLVVSDATWHSRSTRKEARVPALHGAVEWWGKKLLKLLDGQRTHYCFLSRSEVENFIVETGINSDRVHFTPFSCTIWADELSALREIPAQAPSRYIFSGGNASRDYDLLSRAVDGTGLDVRIATTASHAWPREITAGPVSHQEFMRMMGESAAVAVVMDSETQRSGGQQTYLNAMLLGRPVVVNDVVGVRDYLVHGETAIVVPPNDADALRTALLWVADPKNKIEIEAIVERAQTAAMKNTPEAYFAGLIELTKELGAQNERSSAR